MANGSNVTSFSLWDEWRAYLEHVLALFQPGKTVRNFGVHPTAPGDISSWSHADQDLLIAEGRRQLDRQRADFERIQGRSQFLFTTDLALLALMISGRASVASHGGSIAFGIWYLGIVFISLSMLGSAALLAVQARFGTIDCARLTNVHTDAHLALAQAYAGRVAEGENSVATRLTVFRDAVLLVVLAATSQVVLWLTVLVAR